MKNEWQIVVKFKPRNFYDLGENEQEIEHKDHMKLWFDHLLDDNTFESEAGIK